MLFVRGGFWKKSSHQSACEYTSLGQPHPCLTRSEQQVLVHDQSPSPLVPSVSPLQRPALGYLHEIGRSLLQMGKVISDPVRSPSSISSSVILIRGRSWLVLSISAWAASGTTASSGVIFRSDSVRRVSAARCSWPVRQRLALVHQAAVSAPRRIVDSTIYLLGLWRTRKDR